MRFILFLFYSKSLSLYPGRPPVPRPAARLQAPGPRGLEVRPPSGVKAVAVEARLITYRDDAPMHDTTRRRRGCADNTKANQSYSTPNLQLVPRE